MLPALAAAAALSCLPWRLSAAADFTPAPVQSIQSIVPAYFTKNPDVLIDILHAVKEKRDRDADLKAAAAIAEHRREIFENPRTPVGGNPHGKVSLVEFFDYRCPYCKQTQPSLEKLAIEDPELRLV